MAVTPKPHITVNSSCHSAVLCLGFLSNAFVSTRAYYAKRTGGNRYPLHTVVVSQILIVEVVTLVSCVLSFIVETPTVCHISVTLQLISGCGRPAACKDEFSHALFRVRAAKKEDMRHPGEPRVDF